MILKDLIKQIEDHMGQEFDLKNRRHFMHLDGKIERLNQVDYNKLRAIEDIINCDPDQKAFKVIDPKTHTAHKRR